MIVPYQGGQQPVKDTIQDTSSVSVSDSQEARISMDTREVGGLSARKTGFRTIELVSRITIMLIVRFWKLCTSALLLLLLTFWMSGGLVTFLLLCFAVIGLLYYGQDMLLYYPCQPPNSRLYVDLPSIVQLPYENHFIRTRDGVFINVVLIKQKSPDCRSCPTLIYFHGNAGNIGHRLMNAHGMYHQCGFNVLLVEYRGYGKSGGSISESGLYIDAEAAMDFALRQADIDRRKLIVFGRSLGGGVATHLAAQPYYARFIFALVLENTFTSLPDIGKNIFNVKIIQYLPRWAFKNKYPSLDRIKKIKVPVLFISGLSDTLIPPQMMHTLHEMCGSPFKHLATFEGGTHNETWMCQDYYHTLRTFTEQVYQTQQSSDENKAEFVSVDTGADMRTV
ncbi:protein ABHD13-like [Liolophura sinensis]|uniref:protein ABHD13-like n=1 Tax=Liolophura sinensis TaxID=3198878 RepID=UPI003158DC1C